MHCYAISSDMSSEFHQRHIRYLIIIFSAFASSVSNSLKSLIMRLIARLIAFGSNTVPFALVKMNPEYPSITEVLEPVHFCTWYSLSNASYTSSISGISRMPASVFGGKLRTDSCHQSDDKPAHDLH